MIVPISWLKSFVEIDRPVKDFVEDITLTGTKVETVTSLGSDLTNIVAGKILSVEKHLGSDHLLIAQVDAGEKKLQIVTGAQNIYAGASVPVVLDGGTISGGQKIKTGKLRGALSEGMLCSIEELGYTRQDYPEAPEDGIYIFPEVEAEKWPPGSDVKAALQLADDALEFEITSNRPDCYSVLGIAREAAATYNKPLTLPDTRLKEEADGDINKMISVAIEDPALCPRYIARVVKNVKIAPSPLWLRQRLIASGLRPINNIVDITNYVMLELGQPMHAFDIDNIDERKIIIRRARESETFTTLDGVSRALDPSMLVIADCHKAVAIAGVMGGENSKVTENASGILFESANFNGTNIRLTSKKLGLRTDASSRYEKGLDPNLALDAVNRAVRLVEELCCGQSVKGMADCYPSPRISWDVRYSPNRINRLLGTTLTSEEMRGYLARLEIKAEAAEPSTEFWTAHIPTFRPDLELEADIAEEVARLYGYNTIPNTLSAGTPTVGRKNYKQILEDLVKSAMLAQGYDEAMTYSFESPKAFDKLRLSASDKLRGTVKILNPLGEDYSVMRTTALNGMLTALSTNYSQRNEDVRLFEAAKVYWPKTLPLNDLPYEMNVLALGTYGKMDFYALKGALENLFGLLGIHGAVFEADKNLPFLHPGRAAVIKLGKIEKNGKIATQETLGYLGEAHPEVCENYDIGVRVLIGSLNLDKLFEYADLARQYQPLPKFPAVTRDIAMLVKEEIPVRAIEDAIREKAGAFLESVRLFDVYKGNQIEEGYKSAAYSISFRAPDHTMKDEEASESIKKILANLETKLNARLRDK
ncbi:MAG: phenylalanine--tRNA ligase subunit beta [Clostridiales bacterium]|nr:phenylalanine--tRNA ligase subunit beta [Clostridiales bacterium]